MSYKDENPAPYSHPHTVCLEKLWLVLPSLSPRPPPPLLSMTNAHTGKHTEPTAPAQSPLRIPAGFHNAVIQQKPQPLGDWSRFRCLPFNTKLFMCITDYRSSKGCSKRRQHLRESFWLLMLHRGRSVNKLGKQLSLRGSSEASFLTLSPTAITATGRAAQQGSQAPRTCF